MPAYHPTCIVEDSFPRISGMTLLPIRTTSKSQNFTKTPDTTSAGELDVIDEALQLFKANIFFRNYEISTEVDRLFIYITLYIQECLKKIQTATSKVQAQQLLFTLAISRFDLPGYANFPLNNVCTRPATPEEADQLTEYLRKLRLETGSRLCHLVFDGSADQPSKWWTCFSRHKFLNLSLA